MDRPMAQAAALFDLYAYSDERGHALGKAQRPPQLHREEFKILVIWEVQR